MCWMCNHDRALDALVEERNVLQAELTNLKAFTEECLMWVSHGPFNQAAADKLLQEAEEQFGLIPKKRDPK